MLLAVVAGALVAGCGQKRQDAVEPSGTFKLDVVRASFPANQRIGQAATLRIAVRNAGNRTVPDVAVTVNSFTAPSGQPNLASSQRPRWIVDQGPGAHHPPPIEGAAGNYQGGAVTAYTNTWALGPLAAGRTATFTWKVTPDKAGAHEIRYIVAAGLNGKARAQRAGGRGAPRGRFKVVVSTMPRGSHIDPSTGRVAAGAPPQGQ